MSNYVKATNFAVKDGLVTTDPAKIIKGTDIDNEYNAIANAIASKADVTSPSLLGTPTAPTATSGTNTTQLANTAFVQTAISVALSGVIVMWSGSIASVPTGWVICNGSNGTPDLRDRFLVGAGSTYAVGATGGANTVTLDTTMIPSHTHSIAGSGTTSVVSNDHSHTFSGNTGGQSNSHNHTVNDPGHSHTAYINRNGNAQGGGGSSGAQYTSADPGTATTPSGTGIWLDGANADHSHAYSGTTSGISANHTHTWSFSGTSGATGGALAHENRPPYYALAFIMKT